MAVLPTEPGAEWSVLLTACSVVPIDQKLPRLRSAVGSKVEWERLFALSDQHGVQPLVYQALQPVRDAVPTGQMRELERTYQANLHRLLLLSRELVGIVHELRRSDLNVIPYKGPALAEFLYGDIALRQSGDIDLLARQEDLSGITAALAKLGYTPQTRFSEVEQRAYLKSGYECVFDSPAGRNILEVQWAIEPRFYSVDFDMNGIFDRAMPVTVAGQAMKAVSPSDLFLILAVHAAKHMWERLIWICDLARLMSHPSIDWNWIETLAKSLGIMRIVKVSMVLAKRLLGAEVPDSERNWITQDIDTRFVDCVLQNLFSDSRVSVESPAYFRSMLRLRERSSDRLRFLSRLVFTPGPGEWNAIRLPARLFPLYRLLRLCRLLARFLHVT